MARTGTTLVAELSGRFAGFAVVEFEGRSAHLAAIAVREADRGLGVGAHLLQAVEALGRKRGAQTLQLCTADSNLAALDLFLKRGFRIEKRLSRFYARGQSACQLAKVLA
jgi:ribosomal protein S18 acetylase RimI-like enzyme